MNPFNYIDKMTTIILQVYGNVIKLKMALNPHMFVRTNIIITSKLKKKQHIFLICCYLRKADYIKTAH